MISNNNFILNEIPNFHPLDLQRKLWWKEEKRKIFEGYWSGGRWMPGPVYMYINFWTILLNKGRNSKVKVAGRPMLRDLEWEKGYIYMEARGFSGFSNDPEFTCNELYRPEVIAQSKDYGYIDPEDNRTYVPARDYLRKIHDGDKGKPLFENQAKNIIDIEARGGGKSYFGSCIIAHNFITDGATDYDDYLTRLAAGRDLYSSETLVGAIDAKYSKDLLSKFKFGYDELPGSIRHNDILYPSPLFKEYKGSLQPSEKWEAVHQEKVGNNWVERGSRSKIHHRTFQDNPFAANGTRPGVTLLDEIGFMYNLEDALGALKECTANGAEKFGTIWLFGTGGDMSGGATVAAQKVFYDPIAYDALAFPDEWEGRSSPIGYFVPASRTLNQFKNTEGITNEKMALEFLEIERSKLKTNKSMTGWNNELQNRPLTHSEAFLVTGNNKFPVAMLRERQAELEANDKYLDAHWVGVLRYREENLRYELEVKDDIRPIRIYPVTSNMDKTGAIEIFEKPVLTATGGVQRGRYIGGIDPIDDDYSTTDSLGSILIMDTLTRRIVAEYTGRPETAREFHETCRRLLLYYNAVALYENNWKGLYTYFQTMKSTHLLADTPVSLRDTESWKEGTNKSKGLAGTTQNNAYGRSLIKDYLLEPTPGNSDILNLYRLRSLGLIQELIKYNPEANFDRISALGMLLIFDAETARENGDEQKEKKKSFLTSDYFKGLGLVRDVASPSGMTAEMDEYLNRQYNT
jgi:hypothetical protein